MMNEFEVGMMVGALMCIIEAEEAEKKSPKSKNTKSMPELEKLYKEREKKREELLAIDKMICKLESLEIK